MVGGIITSLTDLVGDAAMSAIGAPSLDVAAQNGLDAISCTDNASNYLSTAVGVMSAPFTVVSLVRYDHDPQPSGNYDYVVSIGKSGTLFNNARWNGDGRFYNYNGSSTLYGPVLSAGWHIMVHSMETSAPNHRLRLDGESVTVDDYATATVDGQIALGIYNKGGSHPLNGAIGDVLIVEGSLSSVDAEKLEGYLAHKWGLTSLLPAGHPYKSSPP